MMRLVVTGMTVIGLLVAPLPVTATPQTAIEDELDGAKVLYRDGRLEAAIGALRTVIAKLNDLRNVQNRAAQLAEAHLHLGLAYLAMRDESAAVESFRQVAALDPDRVLDPEIYSPRVLEMFGRARSDVVRKPSRDVTPPLPEASKRAPTLAEGTVGQSALVRILPGSKVRVERTGRLFAIEGSLLSINENFVTVGAEDWRVDVPRETLTRVHVVAKRKTHWLQGMAIGAGFGAVVGALETPGCGGNDGDCYTRGENIGYSALGLGMIGALVGALYKTDQWVEVPLDRTAHTRSLRPLLSVSFSLRY